MSTYDNLQSTVDEPVIRAGKFIVTFFGMTPGQQWVPLHRAKISKPLPNPALIEALQKLDTQFMPGCRFAFQIDKEPE